MNETTASHKFFMHVTSSDSSQVWPHSKDKEMDERIKETYFHDEDWASASFEVKNMPDLLKIVRFYEGKRVEMTLTFQVDAPEFTTKATLADRNPPSHATFRFKEEGVLSPQTAANKIAAISHAMQRWVRDENRKEKKR